MLLRIEFDPDVDRDWVLDDLWTIYSFGRKHGNYRHPDNFLPPDKGLKKKLKNRTAFFLSYFEHGNCVWSLQGEGPKCPWDSVYCAGLLLWEGKPTDLDRTPKQRKEQARRFLERYTDYCNGDVFRFELEDDEGKLLDSCGGFVGEEHLKMVLTDEHPELFETNHDGQPGALRGDVKVVGEAAGLFC